MKKILILLGCVLTSISLNAQDPLPPMWEDPLFDPEGEEESYIMAYTDNNGFYSQDYTNGKVKVRKNGTTYYFNGLTPGGNRSHPGAEESWLVGEIEGDEIVIKAGQVLVENQANKLYFQVVHADESGEVTDFKNETRLKIGENGELTTPNEDIFAIYEHGETQEEAGFFGFFFNLKLNPIGDFTEFEFPKEVTPQTYVFTGIDMYENKQSRFVKVAFCDGVFYVSGLASKSPEEVYQGTYTTTMATIPSFQIVKYADLFYYRIAPVTVDADGNPKFQNTIDFEISEDRKTLTLSPSNAYLCETSYDLKEFATTAAKVTMTFYEGDHATKPKTPTIENWDPHNNALIFNIFTEDVDGEYINPDLLTYRIYADGELYSFSTTDYERLSEDMDAIPFAFTDHFDIVNNGTQKVIFFHNLNAKKLEVESVYTVEGVETVSDRALYDFDPSNIEKIPEKDTPISVIYYTIDGRRISAPVSEEIVLKQSEFKDGKLQFEKMIIK